MAEGSEANERGALDEAVGSMDVERYAEILAHTLFFPPEDEDEVLERLGVARAEWDRASKAHQEAMAAAARDAKLSVLGRYAAAIEPARAALSRARPPLSAIGAAQRPPAGEAAPKPAAEAKRAPETPVIPEAKQAPRAAPSEPPPPEAPAPPPPARVDPEASLFASFTVERYASLCVELARFPLRAAATLERFGLTPLLKDRLDQHWRGRLTRDAALMDAWQKAYAQYDAWLRQSTGKPQ